MSTVRALVEGSPQIAATAPAQTSIADTAALIVAANPKRKGLIVQNTGTTVIKLALGSTVPDQLAYHIALKACSTADDGLGGVYFDDGWAGPVYGISSAAGGTFVLTEITTGNPDWNLASDPGRGYPLG